MDYVNQVFSESGETQGTSLYHYFCTVELADFDDGPNQTQADTNSSTASAERSAAMVEKVSMATLQTVRNVARI